MTEETTMTTAWTDRQGRTYVLYDYMGSVQGATTDREVAVLHAERMNRICQTMARSQHDR